MVYCTEASEMDVGSPGKFSGSDETIFCELSKANWRTSFRIRIPGLFQSDEWF